MTVRLNPDASATYKLLLTMASQRRSLDLSTDPAFFALLTESFDRLVGRSLVPPGKDAAWLYHEAPFAVLAHDTQDDPHFIYANASAQACFEYSWMEFLSLPSRLSAVNSDWAVRQGLLEEVARKGYVSNYRGMRVTKSGHRFIIEDGVIWELIAEDGARHGQAATFRSWRSA
jgi:hypothetical protein